MINFILHLMANSYPFLLLAIAISFLFIFVFGLYFILRKKSSSSSSTKKNKTSFNDFAAIAGEDVIFTQLDLARAYIETGRKEEAFPILQSVVARGSVAQQQEAKYLLNNL